MPSATGRRARTASGPPPCIVGEGKYREATIGVADDVLDADGVSVLDFEQARKAVLAKIEEWRAKTKAAANGGVQTVRTAVKHYIAGMNNREDAQGRPRRDAERRLEKHVLGDPIADADLHNLTESALIGVAEPKARAIESGLAEADREQLQGRAQRRREKVSIRTLPAEIGVIVKHGLAVEGDSEPMARDDAALQDAEIRRILAAAAEVDAEDGWEGDLHRMIAVLAATGTRFSQAARIKVGDLQADKARLMIPVSRKGRGGKSSSHTSGRIGEDVVSLLLPAARGRRPGEPLLMRWLHEQRPGGKWVRDGRHAWKAPAELARPWAAIRKKSLLPQGTVIYALRHSSIVRQLKAGLPVRLVAALHDTSTAMIERHYSSSIASMMEDLAAGAIIPLIDREQRKVVPLRG